jgi:hypothetical protein
VALYNLLQNGAFDPANITLMTAFADALRVLHLKNRDDPIIEMIAKKLIEITQTGEPDPIAISRLALTQLGISRDEWDT